MNKTGIAWTESSWNPIHGCSKVSDGCSFCYAEHLSLRHKITREAWTKPNAPKNILLQHHKLGEVLAASKKPKMVFVCSMSDIMHEDVPDIYRAAIWALMLWNNKNTYQVLTKRPDVLRSWINDQRFMLALQSSQFEKYRLTLDDPKVRDVLALCRDFMAGYKSVTHQDICPPHIWTGVSVESPKHYDRIETLRAVASSVRWISAEPLLARWNPLPNLAGIDWLVAGGESGHHLVHMPERVMEIGWATEIRDYCLEKRVAFFFKQQSSALSGYKPYLPDSDGTPMVWRQYPNQFHEPTRHIS